MFWIKENWMHLHICMGFWLSYLTQSCSISHKIRPEILREYKVKIQRPGGLLSLNVNHCYIPYLSVWWRWLRRKLNLCGIMFKRPCPRSWNLLLQACIMWLRPALPSSAPSLLVSGDFMWEKDKPLSSSCALFSFFSPPRSSSVFLLHNRIMWSFKALGV